jgi:hypothetical protein
MDSSSNPSYRGIFQVSGSGYKDLSVENNWRSGDFYRGLSDYYEDSKNSNPPNIHQILVGGKGITGITCRIKTPKGELCP